MFLIVSLSGGVSNDDAYFTKYFLPENITAFFLNMLDDAPKTKSITIVSALATLWAASNSMYALMKGIHLSFTHKKPRLNVKYRTKAILLTLALLVVVFSSFSVLLIWDFISQHLFGALRGSNFLIDILRYFAAALVIFVFMLVLYAAGSNEKPRTFVRGAMFTAVVWTVVSYAFEFYLNNFNKYATLYGTIGIFLALVLWLNIISTVILLGAAISAVTSKK